MSHDRLLAIGLTGTVIAALCCFTPILVAAFGALGLSALVGVIDIVVLPALLLFLALTAYALWKRKTTHSS